MQISQDSVDMIKIRGHHLLCVLCYSGEGYTSDFVKNYNAIIERLKNGASIKIVDGPDDICRPMLNEIERHCHEERIFHRDQTALEAISKVLDEELSVGSKLVIRDDMLAKMRRDFNAPHVRAACEGCRWYTMCTDTSDCGFRDALLGKK